MSLSFKKLESEIRRINDLNGWKTAPSDWELETLVPSKLALIHSEISEALEGFRSNDKENFTEELADVIIRVLDLSSGLEIDVWASIWKKLEKNTKRGYKHGGKRI